MKLYAFATTFFVLGWMFSGCAHLPEPKPVFEEAAPRANVPIGDSTVVEGRAKRLGDRLCVSFDVLTRPSSAKNGIREAFRLAGEIPLPPALRMEAFGFNNGCRDTITGTERPEEVAVITHRQWADVLNRSAAEILRSVPRRNDCFAVQGRDRFFVGCRAGEAFSWRIANASDLQVPRASLETTRRIVRRNLDRLTSGGRLLLIQACATLKTAGEDACLAVFAPGSGIFVPIRAYLAPEGEAKTYKSALMSITAPVFWAAAVLEGFTYPAHDFTIDAICEDDDRCPYTVIPDWRRPGSG